MSEGRLSLPKASEKVEVVYITPRFICTSRHAIKIYADKLLKRRLGWSIGGISLSFFLTTAPLALTEQKFTDTWFASAETIQVLMSLVATVSLIGIAGSIIFCGFNWKKANSDYMIRELMQDEDSLERTDREGERNTTIPMDSFLNNTSDDASDDLGSITDK